MAQEDGDDPRLQVISARLQQDHPRLHGKPARSGLLFVTARLAIAAVGLVSAVVLLLRMNGLGIEVTHFAVALVIIGVTEAARRAIQPANLIKDRRSQR
ncbi:hypothetical protein AB0L59_20255 [Streptomyces sp. NPDC052109]|uniref:hypothetical protein n=1 Tax=Streptomyces sp. NPDC052109 TaxID=3155527 RepID=UPI0034368DDB